MKLKEPFLYWLKPGKIQPINYTLFILILVGSSIVRYRVGVNSLNQKLRVEELNGALEDIANHDSLTHLYNRHSLSRMNRPMWARISASGNTRPTRADPS